MGKGDRKTLRGKTYRGSYGNTRTHRVKLAVVGKQATGAKSAEIKKVAIKKKPN